MCARLSIACGEWKVSKSANAETKGQLNMRSAFAAAPDWWNNACVNSTNPFDATLSYADGYKEAGDLLVAEAQESHMLLDSLVYPIVFLYRHWLELSLKRLIGLASILREQPVCVPSTHKLDRLWVSLKSELRSIDTGTSETDLVVIGACVEQFSSVDPSSTGFRYSHTPDWKSNLGSLLHVNLRLLKENVAQARQILEPLDTCLSGYVDACAEMRVG